MPKENDTLFINIAKLTKPKYTLQIFSQKMNAVNAFLEDKYLKTSQPLLLNDTNRIEFNITTDAASFDANRFRIVFGKSDLQQIIAAKKPEIKVFPNPVKDQQIHLHLREVEKGTYYLQLFNSQGQRVMRQELTTDGTLSEKIISINKKITAGIYYLQLANNLNSYRQNIFIE